MKRSRLKFSLAALVVLTTLAAAPTYAGMSSNLSAQSEQAFINEYAQKVSTLLQEIFTLFDDYTNPAKGGSHSEYTNKAKAKVAEYKKLMDSLEEKMKNCPDKNSTFYTILEKASTIAKRRYSLLEQVCQVMETYKGTGSNFQLGMALKPLKNQLTSATANAQLCSELAELKGLMDTAKIANAAQLQAVIDTLAKPQPDSDIFAQLDVLGKRLAQG